MKEQIKKLEAILKATKDEKLRESLMEKIKILKKKKIVMK